MGLFAAAARLSAGMLLLAIVVALLALFIVIRIVFAAIALTFLLAPLIVVGLVVWLIVRATSKKAKGAA